MNGFIAGVALTIVAASWGGLIRDRAHRMSRTALRWHAVLGVGVLMFAGAWAASW